MTSGKRACAAAFLLTSCIGLQAAEPAPPPSATATEHAVARVRWGDPDVSGAWAFAPDPTVNPGSGSFDLVNGAAQEDIDVLAKGQPEVMARLKWPGSMVRGAPDGDVPYQPRVKARRDERARKLLMPPTEDFVPSGARCLLYGMPQTMLRLNPRVYQFPDHILMIWEYPQMHRIIWTDGRPPLPPQIKLWQGFSVGRWDGDTLTVTTTNQNGFPWLDQAGNIMSENTKTTETIKVLGSTSLAYKVVVEDPTIYTQPWWMEWRFNIRKPGVPGPTAAGASAGGTGAPTDFSGEILEIACVEGNRSHALESVHQPAPAKARKAADGKRQQ